MDDSALTHQLKQGNQLAFTILYDTYSEQVYRLAFKYLCNKELAEDAVQNLFMKVWIKRTSLDESRPLNHFLFTVLKNDLLTILRDPKNNIFVLDDCLELLERIDGGNQDDEDMDKEQLDLVRHAIEHDLPLPPSFDLEAYEGELAEYKATLAAETPAETTPVVH